MTPNWQQRRSTFNHDWLRNRFLTAVASFVNILDDLVEDPETEKRFVRDILPQWADRARESEELVADFNLEMSPRSLFRQPPLCRCEPATMRWLPDLVHLLWRRRVDVDRLCSDARESVARAKAAYGELCDGLSECADCSSTEALRPYRDQFAAFRSKCEDVSRAISRFPSRIQVI